MKYLGLLALPLVVACGSTDVAKKATTAESFQLTGVELKAGRFVLIKNEPSGTVRSSQPFVQSNSEAKSFGLQFQLPAPNSKISMHLYANQNGKNGVALHFSRHQHGKNEELGFDVVIAGRSFHSDIDAEIEFEKIELTVEIHNHNGETHLLIADTKKNILFNSERAKNFPPGTGKGRYWSMELKHASASPPVVGAPTIED